MVEVRGYGPNAGTKKVAVSGGSTVVILNKANTGNKSISIMVIIYWLLTSNTNNLTALAVNSSPPKKPTCINRILN